MLSLYLYKDEEDTTQLSLDVWTKNDKEETTQTYLHFTEKQAKRSYILRFQQYKRVYTVIS